MSLGLVAADHLFQLVPVQAGYYVLLSNIYAKAGRWNEVTAVRSVMKSRGISKMPGCSNVEMGKRVHTFLVGDQSHPQTKEIYEELDVLVSKMKEAGYVPETNSALHDVEEEDKECHLAVHSEKLAIVFVIINTEPGTPIRITKNLRVCGDCHVAAKHISKITEREIISAYDKHLFSAEDLKQLKASYNLIGEESNLASYSGLIPSSSIQLDLGVRQPPWTPPVRMLSERITLVPAARNFEKQQSANPELTCFRIDENTSTSEETEKLDEGLYVLSEVISPTDSKISSNRKPLVDMTNSKTLASISLTKSYNDRDSIESVHTGINISGMQIDAKQKLRDAYCENKGAKKDKDNQSFLNRWIGCREGPSLFTMKPKLSRKASVRKKI
ncbi:hypothetical protein IFM89_014729 [Coptis chinensis]|uniref:DYW domain-containing protein n=1 Tax=Coptis chinensis TaxID=261450 RepID=A0A835IR53_9MAGN|nr:hypothetical protein IFM89_014729 [Coptis chinensis]